MLTFPERHKQGEAKADVVPLKVVVYLQPEILTAPNFLTWNKCSLSPPVPFIGHYTTQN